MFVKTFVVISVLVWSAVCEIEYNEVNDDGSFAFRHSNDDIGSYYHSASGSPDRTVRGRYGSRNPSNGQVEEVVYTAGPRGFRANGPQIHRKMDLSQYPGGPIGSIDDPLADPNDDPSYSFQFRTSEHERKEDSDSTGRVRGLYSYLDDEGDRHTVRYAAGAGTGFEVLNAVPDAGARAAYNAPLYKAPSWTRGKMATERGPDGQYKFIASGPDHRRSETSGPDGVVRGSYSYLDDKGVQRTVEYIAGAGIGYKVVHNTIGTGTHLNARPAYLDFGTGNSRREFLETSGSGRIRSKDDDREYQSDRDEGDSNRKSRPGDGSSFGSNKNRGQISNSIINRGRNEGSGSIGKESGNRGQSGDRGANDSSSDRGESGYRYEKEGSSNRNENGSRGGQGAKNDGSLNRGQSGSRGGQRANDDGSLNRGQNQIRGGNDQNDEGSSNRGGQGESRGGNDDRGRYGGGSSSANDKGYDYKPPRGESRKQDESQRYGGNRGNYNSDRDTDRDNIPPTVTHNRKFLEVERERDWSQRSRDSSIIRNVGKWYIGLPPGQAVRAHVQNIDISPFGGRIPSPSEALRMDELHDRPY